MRRGVCAHNRWCTLHSQWVDDFSDENDHSDQNPNCIKSSDLIWIWIWDLVGSLLISNAGFMCWKLCRVAAKCQIRVKLVDIPQHTTLPYLLPGGVWKIRILMMMMARIFSVPGLILRSRSPPCRQSSPHQHSSPFLQPALRSCQVLAQHLALILPSSLSRRLVHSPSLWWADRPEHSIVEMWTNILLV